MLCQYQCCFVKLCAKNQSEKGLKFPLLQLSLLPCFNASSCWHVLDSMWNRYPLLLGHWWNSTLNTYKWLSMEFRQYTWWSSSWLSFLSNGWSGWKTKQFYTWSLFHIACTSIHCAFLLRRIVMVTVQWMVMAHNHWSQLSAPSTVDWAWIVCIFLWQQTCFRERYRISIGSRSNDRSFQF